MAHLNAAAGVTDDILETTTAIANVLKENSVRYAIVGGAGLIAMGSSRVTEDVDLVVYPPSAVKTAKDLMRGSPGFSMDPRTRHLSYQTKQDRVIDIQVLSFPGTFKAEFNESTAVVDTPSGAVVVDLPVYLESKCGAIQTRASDDKRKTDLDDIVFLLKSLEQEERKLQQSEVPSATKELISTYERFLPGLGSLFNKVLI
jgi:hypothetical protein